MPHGMPRSNSNVPKRDNVTTGGAGAHRHDVGAGRIEASWVCRRPEARRRGFAQNPKINPMQRHRPARGSRGPGGATKISKLTPCKGPGLHRRRPVGGGQGKIGRITPCKANCPCTRAHAAARARAPEPRVPRPRCRTAGAACMAAALRVPRGTATLSSTASTPPRRRRGGARSANCCATRARSCVHVLPAEVARDAEAGCEWAVGVRRSPKRRMGAIRSADSKGTTHALWCAAP